MYYRLQLAKAPHCCSLIYIAHHLKGDINSQSLNIYRVHLLDQSLVIFLAAVFQQGLPEEFSFNVNVHFKIYENILWYLVLLCT